MVEAGQEIHACVQITGAHSQVKIKIESELNYGTVYPVHYYPIDQSVPIMRDVIECLFRGCPTLL
jgi:hypothetical protein